MEFYAFCYPECLKCDCFICFPNQISMITEGIQLKVVDSCPDFCKVPH